MELANACRTKDIVWDTVNNRICFDIKPNSIGANRRIVVAKNQAGRIEMHMQDIIGQEALAGRVLPK